MPDEFTCQRCGVVDQDLRTLWHSCLYAMEETGLPFAKRDEKLSDSPSVGRSFYTLRVCKACRASWMAAIAAWFRNPPAPEAPDPERNIPMRVLGETKMVTRAEYDAMRAAPEATSDPLAVKIAEIQWWLDNAVPDPVMSDGVLLRQLTEVVTELVARNPPPT